MTLLAFIGIIAIIYFLGKWLRQLGTWMENIGGGKQQGILYTQKQTERDLASIKKTSHVNEQNKTDENYINKVREEIDRLT